MTIEQLLHLIRATRQEDLDVLQTKILLYSWEGKTYATLAKELHYRDVYVKNTAYKLWQVVSEILGMPVTKSNFRSIVEQYVLQSPPPPENKAGSREQEYPEFPGSPVPLNSQFYLDRLPLEARCYEAISHPAALLDIKAPRQMGKTSLVLRIMNQARNLGYRTLVVNLHEADSALFSHLDKFLIWFCATIARKREQIAGSREQEREQGAARGSKDNCTAFMEKSVLSAADTPVLLVLEKMDAIFAHPEIADDFLRLLMFWHEQATYGEKNSILWEKLRLVLVRTTVLAPALDVNQSPLSIGLPIELQPFTPEQVDKLALRHQLHLSSQQLEQLNQLVAGHPYLVRLALYHIARDNISIEEMFSTATSDASIYHHHLHQLLGHLQQHPVLAVAFAEVLKAPTPIKLELKLAYQLYSLGLVDIKDNGVTASCQLYRQYFQNMF